MADGDELDPFNPLSEAEVPVADILAYFRQKKYNCEICNTFSWFTSSAPGTVDAISHISSPTSLKDEGYDIVTYPITCIECGNTKFINKVIIKYELKKMREDAGQRGGK